MHLSDTSLFLYTIQNYSVHIYYDAISHKLISNLSAGLIKYFFSLFLFLPLKHSSDR